MIFTKVLSAAVGLLVVELSDGTVQRRSEGTVAWRCQNPGNLKNGPFAESYGSIGEDAGGHAVFPTFEMGVKAHYGLLFNPKSRYYSLTLLDAIKRYAPESDGNNPYQYQKDITRNTGIQSNRLLRTLNEDERSAMLERMRFFEGYREGEVDDQPPAKIKSEKNVRKPNKRVLESEPEDNGEDNGSSKGRKDYW